MQRKALSNLPTFYVKLRIEPCDATTPGATIDKPTLLSLFNKANLASFGKVGAGAISMLGDGLEILSIQQGPEEEGEAQRDVILRLASSAVTPFLATLPLSDISMDYSVQVLGKSASLLMLQGTNKRAHEIGSHEWANSFAEVSPQSQATDLIPTEV